MAEEPKPEPMIYSFDEGYSGYPPPNFAFVVQGWNVIMTISSEGKIAFPGPMQDDERVAAICKLLSEVSVPQRSVLDREAIEKAFALGFLASREGWNAEHPWGVDDAARIGRFTDGDGADQDTFRKNRDELLRAQFGDL